MSYTCLNKKLLKEYVCTNNNMALQIPLSNYGSTAFEKLLGHNPEILDKWVALEQVCFNNTTIEKDILEQVRRTLAFGNECEYCMVKAGRPEERISNARMETAVAFAEMFAVDHKSIIAGHFEMLSHYFLIKEIAELCSFIAFITACQQFGKIMNLTEEYQNNKTTSMEILFPKKTK